MIYGYGDGSDGVGLDDGIGGGNGGREETELESGEIIFLQFYDEIMLFYQACRSFLINSRKYIYFFTKVT